MSEPDRPDGSAVTAASVYRVTRSRVVPPEPDALAVEEPLEIRLGMIDGERRVHRAVAVTMRTPGNDGELAAGFLFTEGIVSDPHQIAGVHACTRTRNTLRVDLRPGVAVDWARFDRHSYTSSSCGVCGKLSLDAIRVAPRHPVRPGRPDVDASVVHRLPDLLRATQPAFEQTGGLHAAALFDPAGALQSVREDVGRHNALDKLIGAQFLAGRTPLSGGIVLVSGRLGFELVQKAAVAGIPVVAAIGAPSSLAVEYAREHGMTVVGFVRHDRFNIYAGADRVRLESAAGPDEAPAGGRPAAAV